MWNPHNSMVNQEFINVSTPRGMEFEFRKMQINGSKIYRRFLAWCRDKTIKVIDVHCRSSGYVGYCCCGPVKTNG